ncbi:hypothetical protein EW026_g7746 [Hermanssonia centrifuga]|uniref:Autophagy-related protein 7 n=1 Tax=Hermanssonia centrifuga TaxID=98765 RepID=A0A4S4KB51_9APHY|nr:hypothetical protein EW026_g7746 [Hermanssonia centrifuga]
MGVNIPFLVVAWCDLNGALRTVRNYLKLIAKFAIIAYMTIIFAAFSVSISVIASSAAVTSLLELKVESSPNSASTHDGAQAEHISGSLPNVLTTNMDLSLATMSVVALRDFTFDYTHLYTPTFTKPTFWHALTNLKIDVLQLSDESIPITASYSPGRSIVDRETGREIALGCNITVGGDAFTDNPQIPANSVSATGVFKNFNTIEEFKAIDKTALFNQLTDEVWEGITQGSTVALTRFLLITFADLKKYKYYYWFTFPAFVAKPAWELDGEWIPGGQGFTEEALIAIASSLHSSTRPFFLIRSSGSAPEIAPVEDFDRFFEGVPQQHRTIAFLDPSALPTNPGWPLRNLLAYLAHRHPSFVSAPEGIRVLCWRDTEVPSDGHWKSRFGVVKSQGSKQGTEEKLTAVGWEKNVQGKLGPRLADLAPMMDPARLADQAVDLNLKLMRWRILPSLDLDKIAGTRCLLLGAGTLGCYVARTLMGWGVRTITFVDSARVSFSNPVRQPLFEFEDCLHGGKLKAACAAERLKKIFPGVHPDGINAPPPPTGKDAPDPHSSGSVLGLVPHQLRGFLAEFRNMPITGAAYSRCTGCSDTVLEAYEKEGFPVLLRAFNEPGYLEALTGLDKLYDEGEAALASVDWDIDEGEGDEDM